MGVGILMVHLLAISTVKSGADWQVENAVTAKRRAYLRAASCLQHARTSLVTVADCWLLVMRIDTGALLL
jgi:hypothetical protein